MSCGLVVMDSYLGPISDDIRIALPEQPTITDLASDVDEAN